MYAPGEWHNDMIERVSEEMVLHVDIEHNGIVKGSDLVKAAEIVAADPKYREGFERLVSIAEKTVDEIVSGSPRGE